MMTRSLVVLLGAQYNSCCCWRSTHAGQEMPRAIATKAMEAAQTNTLGISTCRDSTIVPIMKRFT